MNQVLLSTALILILLGPTLGSAGGEGQNGEKVHGGDEIKGEFREIAQQIYDDISQIPFYKKAIHLKKLKDFIRTATITPTDEILNIEGVGDNLTATNKLSANGIGAEIKVNRSKWSSLRALKKKRIVLHEYLGLTGDEINSYEISNTLFSKSYLKPSFNELGIDFDELERIPVVKTGSASQMFSESQSRFEAAKSLKTSVLHEQALRLWVESSEILIGGLLKSIDPDMEFPDRKNPRFNASSERFTQEVRDLYPFVEEFFNALPAMIKNVSSKYLVWQSAMRTLQVTYILFSSIEIDRMAGKFNNVSYPSVQTWLDTFESLKAKYWTAFGAAKTVISTEKELSELDRSQLEREMNFIEDMMGDLGSQ